MFGLGKSTDEQTAEDYCDTVGKLRLKTLDDQMIAKLINEQLIELAKTKPKLVNAIYTHLNAHHPSVLDARFNNGVTNNP